VTASEVHERAREYFTRQIAWFEGVLEESAQFEPAIASGELDALETLQRRFDSEAAALQEELSALSAEWNRAEVSDAAREEIGAMARRAESLSQEVQARFDAAAGLSREAGEKLSAAFGEMTRGKRAMGKYRVEGDARFVDRRV
jgi:Skp family chaperone for outer membrane proteins